MDVKKRSELGIGYYYEREDGRVIYIPIERGKGSLEYWLKNDDSIRAWWKVELPWQEERKRNHTNLDQITE